MVRRDVLVQSRNPGHWFLLLVLPLVDGLLFGSIGVAYGDGDGPVRLLVTGIMLFHLIWQLTLAGSLGLLEEVWSRNLMNLIATPLTERFELLLSPLEQLELPPVHDLAIINISLHEARDQARVVAAARRALRPGGTFLVSEFPFPEHLEACRTLPGQIMSGVQYFEAHIGCQLLPTAHFVALLEAAGFRDVGVIEVTPVHVVIHGTA